MKRKNALITAGSLAGALTLGSAGVVFASRSSASAPKLQSTAGATTTTGTTLDPVTVTVKVPQNVLVVVPTAAGQATESADVETDDEATTTTGATPTVATTEAPETEASDVEATDTEANDHSGSQVEADDNSADDAAEKAGKPAQNPVQITGDDKGLVSHGGSADDGGDD